MSKFYYHGTNGLMAMLDIITSGAIKSQRRLGYNVGWGYNELDFISVCKKESSIIYEVEESTAFNKYVQNKFCFIISDEIDAIKTEYVNPAEVGIHNCKELSEFINLDVDTRYSDMYDEYQVRDTIPLKYIKGIGVPVEDVKRRVEISSNEYLLEKFRLLFNCIKSLGLDIVDTNSPNFVENYESSKNQNNLDRVSMLTMEMFNE